ncbi:MAG: hypothetical protein U0269_19025 [Polyangiales bacterium]
MNRGTLAVVFAASAACGSPTPAPDASGQDGSTSDSATEDSADARADSGMDATTEDASADSSSDARVDSGPPRLVGRTTITQRTDSCVTAPTDFGTYGSVTQYDRYEIDNPAWIGGTMPVPVEVLVPVGGAATHPVLFYSHAFGGSDWTRVRSWLEMLVSNDYVVVFTPYATTNATVCQRYDTLWTGHSLAVDTLAATAAMDTTRVGFIGHSFGAGATPWLATEAVSARRWGSSGIFLMPNAPWYSYRMDAARWATLPASARLHVMVFADDTTNDHRIAIDDQWTPFPRAKQWVELVSARNGTCTLTADHVVPATDSTLMDNVRLDALDFWGVWRHSHALAECVLRGRTQACSVIDGSNPAAQTTMGSWRSDSTAVAPAQRSDMPVPAMPPSAYMFPVARRTLFPCDGRGG